MSALNVLAEGAAGVSLPMPAWAYGMIALAVFGVLGFVVYSFRDVYHRNSAEPPASDGNEQGA